MLGGDLFSLNSPTITLASFSFDGRADLTSQNDPYALADLVGGILVLNTGVLAPNRLVGSATDGDELVLVSAGDSAGLVTVTVDVYSAAYSQGSYVEGDGGQGNDQIALEESLTVAASLSGNDGNDVLAGGGLNDTLSGGADDDVLFGHAGNDSMTGDAGDDLFYGGAGADTMDGGADDDMITYVRAASGVNVNLTTGTGQGDIAQGDSLTRIEILQGSNFNDTLTGSANVDMLIGLNGDDALSGAAGADVLVGSQGNDTLDGGTEADMMVGGEGDDVYIVDNASDIVDENRYGEIPVGTNGGTDRVEASVDWSLETGTQALIENLTLTGTAVVGTGNAADNVLTANQAGLTGGRLNGRAGADTLNGSSAGEILDGGTGADEMIGLGGDDTYFIDNLGDNIVEAGGAGTDSAQVFIQSFTLESADDIERLLLDNSVIDGELVGNALDQTIQGAGGDDTLEGGLGADTYIGSSSSTFGRSHYLSGGDGNDTFAIDASSVHAGAQFDGGAGTDHLIIDWSSITAGMSAGTSGGTHYGWFNPNFGWQRIYYSDVERFTLIGGSAADTLTVGVGNDSLSGNDGGDTMTLNDGNEAGTATTPSMAAPAMIGSRAAMTMMCSMAMPTTTVSLAAPVTITSTAGPKRTLSTATMAPTRSSAAVVQI
ncbi:MAG: hypothetical protein MK098_01420 [Marinovum sp.]|nr:hypothetical protein [Marinovum sp.]